MKLGIVIGMFVSVAILLASTATKGQNELETDQIIVRVYQYSSLASSEIVVSYGNGKSEVVELKSAAPKNKVYNTERIHLVLDKVRKSGYEISTSNAASIGQAEMVATYVFLKS